MKNICIFLVFLFCSSMANAQPNTPKQITDFNFDSRNPVIISTEMIDGEIFFEGSLDTVINIYSLKYDSSIDSFYQLTQITSNSSVNRKIIGGYVYNYPFYNYRIILWETNQNGNWDIAYSIDSGGGWTIPEFLFSSDKDELDPSFTFYPYYFTYYTYQILYSRGNSVYLYTKDTIETEETIFEGNDTVKYSNAVITDSWSDPTAVAERRINGGEPYLVYRRKLYTDSVWSEIKDVFRRAPAVNPKFVISEYNMVLSFEVLFDTKRKVLWINLEDLESSQTVRELLDDQSLETSDFYTVTLPVIITKKRDYYDSYNPYSFRYVRNDSTYIRCATNNGWYSDYSDNYTKVKNAHSSLGLLGYNNGLISYTLWEDSSKGKINLFGLKRINPLGDVEGGETIADEFSLSQNYPNPFNPSTSIQYAVGNTQFVTLKVFDVLGREVATLMNEEKPAGEYEIEFNVGTNHRFALTSGVYFYKLQAGKYSSVKKMIYLK